ncbi:hypothetical protein HaLaN_30054, partial [Haematococcus lacustris]
MSWYNEVYNY